MNDNANDVLTMDDVKIHDDIIIENNVHGGVQGTVVGHDKEKIRFILTNITFLENGYQPKGVRYMYTNDITSVTILKRKVSKEVTKENTQNDDLASLSDLKEINEIAKSFKFINSFDETYKNAMKELNGEEYIGVLGEDSTNRLRRLHVLGMSTTKNIYLFDLLSLGNIKDLKLLLEAKDIKKITTNSHSLADCLHFQYNIKLDGIFDLQLADSYVVKLKTGSFPKQLLTYLDIIKKYLRIPAHLYINKPKLPVVGAFRPLTEEFQEQLATNLSFMQHLSIKIYDHILGPLFKAGSARANSVRQVKDLYDSAVLCNESVMDDDLVNAFEYFEV